MNKLFLVKLALKYPWVDFNLFKDVPLDKFKFNEHSFNVYEYFNSLSMFYHPENYAKMEGILYKKIFYIGKYRKEYYWCVNFNIPDKFDFIIKTTVGLSKVEEENKVLLFKSNYYLYNNLYVRIDKTFNELFNLWSIKLEKDFKNEFNK